MVTVPAAIATGSHENDPKGAPFSWGPYGTRNEANAIPTPSSNAETAPNETPNAETRMTMTPISRTTLETVTTAIKSPSCDQDASQLALDLVALLADVRDLERAPVRAVGPRDDDAVAHGHVRQRRQVDDPVGDGELRCPAGAGPLDRRLAVRVDPARDARGHRLPVLARAVRAVRFDVAQDRRRVRHGQLGDRAQVGEQARRDHAKTTRRYESRIVRAVEPTGASSAPAAAPPTVAADVSVRVIARSLRPTAIELSPASSGCAATEADDDWTAIWRAISAAPIICAANATSAGTAAANM